MNKVTVYQYMVLGTNLGARHAAGERVTRLRDLRAPRKYSNTLPPWSRSRPLI